MKIPTVQLPAALPRPAALVKQRVNLHVHLKPLYWIGGVCVAIGASLMAGFAPRVVRGQADPPYLGALGVGLGFGIMGASVLATAWGRWRGRLRALTHGRLMQARVVGHGTEQGRRWLIMRGRPQHVVRAAVTVDKLGERRGEFRAPYAAVEELLPVGSEIAALVDVDTGTLSFPHELLVGIEIDG